jgi:hypothetical protein
VVIFASIALAISACSSKESGEQRSNNESSESSSFELRSSKKSDRKTLEEFMADAPILVGPPGTQFWTTLANARSLFSKPIVPCKSSHCSHRIGTAEDSMHNRYMSAELVGDNVDLQMVAEADNRYEDTPSGGKILCHKCPEEDAPWIGQSSSEFYFKEGVGTVKQIGEIDSQYRTIGGMQRLMTRGMAEGEEWTGDADGVIYRLDDNGTIKAVGNYDRRWVIPSGSEKRLGLPLMMSKGTAEGSVWIGEHAGVIYVETSEN